MIITVDPASDDPPYQQIRLQVLAGITSGTPPIGARLPTIRQLAEDLELATNTVARAYRELETDGAIETRGRHGSYVRAPTHPDHARARTTHLDAMAQAFVTEARDLGVSAPEIAAAVARALTQPAREHSASRLVVRTRATRR